MIAQQLGARLRAEVLAGRSADPQLSLALLQKLLDVPAARNPKQLLEILLLQSALPATAHVAVAIATPTTQPTSTPKPAPAKVAAPVPSKPEPETVPAPEPHPEPPVEPIPAPTQLPDDTASSSTPVEPANIEDVTELWQATLNEIKKQYNTLYGIARMAEPLFDGETLTLSFKFGFHQKRMNEVKNQKIFTDVVARLHGKPVQIICIVAEATEKKAEKPDMAAISNIFGGAELLES